MQNLWYMDKFSHKKHALLLSLPPRGAWIEMRSAEEIRSVVKWSLPPRGAWIEITDYLLGRVDYPVAPPAGSVD